jgi:hypothetical protein
MAFYYTDGTTARQHNAGVIFGEGKVTTGTSYVDLRYDQARSAGFGYFTLDLSGIKCDSAEFVLRGLSSANTPSTAGTYQGYYAHGEGGGEINASTSGASNNHDSFRLTGGRDGSSSGRYFGFFRVFIAYPVDSSITDINGARPNVWWQGTMRLSGTSASSVAGGGVNTGSMNYGIRIGTDDGTTNWILGSYVLTGYKEGGQF